MLRTKYGYNPSEPKTWIKAWKTAILDYERKKIPGILLESGTFFIPEKFPQLKNGIVLAGTPGLTRVIPAFESRAMFYCRNDSSRGGSWSFEGLIIQFPPEFSSSSLMRAIECVGGTLQIRNCEFRNWPVGQAVLARESPWIDLRCLHFEKCSFDRDPGFSPGRPSISRGVVHVTGVSGGILSHLSFRDCHGDQSHGKDRDCLLLRTTGRNRTQNLIIQGLMGHGVDCLLDAGDCRRVTVDGFHAYDARFAAAYFNNRARGNILKGVAVNCRWGLLTKGRTNGNRVELAAHRNTIDWIAAKDSVRNDVLVNGKAVNPSIL